MPNLRGVVGVCVLTVVFASGCGSGEDSPRTRPVLPARAPGAAVREAVPRAPRAAVLRAAREHQPAARPEAAPEGRTAFRVRAALEARPALAGSTAAARRESVALPESAALPESVAPVPQQAAGVPPAADLAGSLRSGGRG